MSVDDSGCLRSLTREKMCEHVRTKLITTILNSSKLHRATLEFASDGALELIPKVGRPYDQNQGHDFLTEKILRNTIGGPFDFISFSS